MTLTAQALRLAPLPPTRKFHCRVTWFCLPIIMGFGLVAQSTWADESDDKYLHIVEVIQQADALLGKGQTNAALAKYQDARVALRTFRFTYADWNPRAVAYRQKYVLDKIQVCTEQPSQSPAAPAQSPVSNPATEPGGAAPKLLESGAEPRKQLRLHPKAGDKQSLTLDINTATATKLGGMETPAMKIPTMTMNLEVTIQNVSEQGEIGYSAVVTEATVADDPANPQMAAAMKPAMEGLKGLTTTGTITSRGSNKSVELKSAGAADPQSKQATDLLSQSFGTFSIPLPEEPVGTGARWEIRQPVKAQGITLDQTTTYQLASVDGDKLTLKATISQSAANQQVQNPALPGMKMELTKMTGKGTGEITADLGQLLPQQATMNSHSELTMGMNAGGQKQTMSLNIDVDMRIQPK